MSSWRIVPFPESHRAIVPCIYEAAVFPERWRDAVAAICDAFEVPMGMLAMSYPISGQGEVLAFSGFAPEHVALWERRHGISPWAAAALAGDFRVGDVARGCDLVDPEEIQRSETGRELLQPQNIHDMLATMVARTPQVLGHFTLYDDELFEASAVDALVQLAPHLVRAVAMHNRVSWLTSRVGTLERAIEQLPLGLLLLRADGLVLHANPRAQALLDERDGVAVRDGHLAFPGAAARRALEAALAAAIGPKLETTPLAWPRPSGRRAFHAFVCPAAAAFEAASDTALVWTTDPEEAAVPQPEALARLFGLTPAEARLAAALAGGETLRAYAERIGVAESTARWTVKHVLAKTGTARQAELVRLVLTSVPALPR